MFDSFDPFADGAVPSVDAKAEDAGHAGAATQAGDDPQTISASRILQDRPDVLSAYYVAYAGHAHGHHQHAAWMAIVGGDSAETFATFWYQRNGRYEGYNQGHATAGDNIDLGRLLQERPDVVAAYARDYIAHDGWRSNAWRDVLGGSSVQDYAKYWFDHHGRSEGYTQRPAQAAQPAEAAPATAPDPPEQAAIVVTGGHPAGDGLTG